MSPTPATEYPSTSTTHKDDGTILAAAGGQPVATVNISTGKKGLAGSVIAGAIIGGLVVIVLILAIFFGFRHRYRKSKGQTASTTEASMGDEKQSEKRDEANEAPPPCPYSTHVVAYPAATFQGGQNDTITCQTDPIMSLTSLRRSFDSSRTYPIQTNYSNITTHAPRPQSHRTAPSVIHDLDSSSNGAPCMSCALHHSNTSRSGTMTSPSSPGEENQIYDRKQCGTSTSPPLPPGAMPPLPSPTLETYETQFRSLSPSEPPKSPGGSSLRRWIMSPLSRSGTARTVLPPYEEQGEGLQRQGSERKEKEKDESALAASVYTFM
ncbi:unnamed protein product [Rhizoctonia solani]|uniref:Uncharacterized protein n=1 Tax=Rhizoctonia solani TaxID=456999 RepID=A0A8H3AIE9_9AGAM|nr:unnamed protein product [Rhizoctonia solani]